MRYVVPDDVVGVGGKRLLHVMRVLGREVPIDHVQSAHLLKPRPTLVLSRL